MKDYKFWKVWTSSEVFNSFEHKASEIPNDVQVVMYYLEKPQRHVVMGEDFYSIDGVTVEGKEINLERLGEIVSEAMSDTEWLA